MKNTNSLYLLALATIASMVLSACGGGGGDPGAGGSGTTTYTATCYDSTTRTSTISQAAAQALCPIQTSVPIVTSVPAATYAVGSQEKAAYDYLNNARSTCGFGKLKQDDFLDQAANAHLNYMMQLGNAYSHYETNGRPGFTGVTPTDRANAKGYFGTVSEGITNDVTASNTGETGVRSLLNAPYHLRSLMEGFIDIGIATSPGNYLEMTYGVKSSEFKQQPASAEVLTYPCQGISDTDTVLTAESPWPWPGHGAMGQSILVQVAEGNTLVLNSYTITRTAGPGIDPGNLANGSVSGATSMLQKLDWSNDTNSHFTNRLNVAILMPDKTMYPASTYRVEISGTNNGNTFTKDFTFTTKGSSADYTNCIATEQANTNRWPTPQAQAAIPYSCAGVGHSIGTSNTNYAVTLNPNVF